MPRMVSVPALVLVLAGCATVTTVENAGPGTPKVYSGTRMDLHAAAGNRVRLRDFPGEAPRNPLWDLPLSFLLDSAVLPLTVATAAYEVLIRPVEDRGL